MTKKYVAPQNVSSISFAENRLPTDAPIAVYYRQSTEFQVGNISTTIQTVDMVDYLKKLGWTRENIHLIDMDAGVSGTKRIDERPGMRRLFTLITDRVIQAVACQDEDRLFRDITQIQVNIFIEACRNANVLVITPTMVYDFANEQTGQFHARQFRFKSEMAAEYLTSIVLGRLHRSRMRLAKEGRWFGSSMSPGYMIDNRKTLPNGIKNENWRRYVPFEPYAEIVKIYFNLFLETGGNLRATVRRIQDERVYLPDPNTTIPPEGYHVRYGFNRRKDGYFYPTTDALRYMFTNAAYLGHWSLNDVVLIWNNHSPIIEPEIFYRAFNYLSPDALDGLPNKHYRPVHQFARPLTDEERPVDRPLLAGIIRTKYNGKWHNVGTEYVKRESHYRYIFYGGEVLENYVWSKHAEWVDEAVVKLLKEKLTATFQSDIWQKSIVDFEETYLKERKFKEAQINTLEQVQRNLISSLETLSDPDMIKGVQQRYRDATIEHKRLLSELSVSDNAAKQLDFLGKLKEDYQDATDDWDSMSFDEKRVLVQSFVEKVDAMPFDNHHLHLTIHWLDGEQNIVKIRRLPTYGDVWTQTEHETLESLMDDDASQVEIAQVFSHRTWRVIRDRITRTRGKECAVFRPKPIRDFETYKDFIKRVEANPKSLLKASYVWYESQLSLLNEMLDGGATKMEIAKAFPDRLWTNIRAKISKLRGKDFEIAGDKPMRSNESYLMYQQRLGEQEDNDSSPSDSNTDENNRSMMMPVFLKCYC